MAKKHISGADLSWRIVEDFLILKVAAHADVVLDHEHGWSVILATAFVGYDVQ